MYYSILVPYLYRDKIQNILLKTIGRIHVQKIISTNLNNSHICVIIHIIDDQSDTGSIYYFEDNEIVLLYGYHADIYKIENKNLDDNIA